MVLVSPKALVAVAVQARAALEVIVALGALLGWLVIQAVVLADLVYAQYWDMDRLALLHILEIMLTVHLPQQILLELVVVLALSAAEHAHTPEMQNGAGALVVMGQIHRKIMPAVRFLAVAVAVVLVIFLLWVLMALQVVLAVTVALIPSAVVVLAVVVEILL